MTNWMWVSCRTSSSWSNILCWRRTYIWNRRVTTTSSSRRCSQRTLIRKHSTQQWLSSKLPALTFALVSCRLPPTVKDISQRWTSIVRYQLISAWRRKRLRIRVCIESLLVWMTSQKFLRWRLDRWLLGSINRMAFCSSRTRISRCASQRRSSLIWKLRISCLYRWSTRTDTSKSFSSWNRMPKHSKPWEVSTLRTPL